MYSKHVSKFALVSERMVTNSLVSWVAKQLGNKFQHNRRFFCVFQYEIKCEWSNRTIKNETNILQKELAIQNKSNQIELASTKRPNECAIGIDWVNWCASKVWFSGTKWQIEWIFTKSRYSIYFRQTTVMHPIFGFINWILFIANSLLACENVEWSFGWHWNARFPSTRTKQMTIEID